MELDIRYCLTASGTRIAYGSMGHGPAVVAPPGWIGHLAHWQPEWQAFWERVAQQHTVFAYDRPGCGLSERQRTDFGLGPDLAALEAVVDHAKLRRFSLFGISAGGPPALAYAAAHPRRVHRLILYGTRAHWDATGRELRLAIGALIRANWGLASKTLVDVFVPGATQAQAERVAALQPVLASAEIAAGLWDAAVETDVRELCQRIRLPTLVLHREGDQVVPINLGRDLAARIPGARFVALAGDSHGPDFGDSEAILRAMAAFLGDPYAAAESEPSAAATSAGVPHAVFISYASEDQASAETIRAALEGSGVPCWIAPRDIPPGADYAAAIIEAIEQSRAMVVVFSSHANRSPHVRRELERAVSADLPLLPVRVEDCVPSRALAYFLSTAQWLDAHTVPLERALAPLIARLQQVLTPASEP